jgi:transcriptional regulator with XRE-family HTH domain
MFALLLIDVAIMDQDNIIAEWEARAKAAGATIADICGRAGIAPSTFSRWKSGTSITLATANKFDAALRTFEVVAALPATARDALAA